MHCSKCIVVFIYLHVCLAYPTSRPSMIFVLFCLGTLCSRHPGLPAHCTSKAWLASDICYYFCLEHSLNGWLFSSHRSLLKYYLLRETLPYCHSEVTHLIFFLVPTYIIYKRICISISLTMI